MQGNGQNTPPAPRSRNQPNALQPYIIQHQFGGSAELTTTLVHAISDVSGADVTQAEFTLADYVDPDALNALFKPTDDGTLRLNGHISFTVWGHQVTIYSDGQIAITPPSQTQRR